MFLVDQSYYSIKRLFVFLFIVVVQSAGVTCAQEEVRDFYEETGVNRFQEQVSDAPSESVDPFSGLVQVSHNDITIPGNNGLDVVVRRAYTSRSKGGLGSDSIGGFGAGWVMHFGRIVVPQGHDLCGQFNTTFEHTLDNPSVELTSGGRELLVESSIEGVSGLITRSNLRGRCVTNPEGGEQQYEIRSPNGRSYILEKINGPWRVVRIADLHGNWIRIEYNEFGLPTEVYRIDEGDTALLNFSYDDQLSIDKIEFGEQVWDYEVEQRHHTAPGVIGIDFQLVKVTRPDGKTWEYDYHDNDFHPVLLTSTPGAASLKSLRYPDGGLIEYTYQEVLFNQRDDEDISHAVYEKTVSDELTNDSATWAYTFQPRLDPSYPGADSIFINGESIDLTENLKLDVTTIESPFGSEVYRYFGSHLSSYLIDVPNSTTKAEVFTTFPTSRIGSLARKEVYSPSGELLEARGSHWNGRKISDEWFVQGAKYPIAIIGAEARQTEVLDVIADYVTEPPRAPDTGAITGPIEWQTGFHALTSPSNYDEFGNPRKVVYSSSVTELSDLTVEYTYLNDLDKWILGLPLTEVYKDGDTIVGTVTREYHPDTRDLIEETRFGVTSDYDYHPNGDLKEVVDENGIKTLYEDYKAGTPQKETRGIATRFSFLEETTVTLRTINPTGTIADMTNPRGFKTSFTYDLFNRLETITYPQNNPASVGYENAVLEGSPTGDAGSLCVRCARRVLTRGDYVQSDYLDGFGRIIATSRGSNSDQSFTSIDTKTDFDIRGLTVAEFFANSDQGTQYEYDNLGRLVKQTNSDGSIGTLSYDRNAVFQTDENGNTTETIYKNRGSDFSGRIVATIREPEDIVTVFESDVLGNTMRISHGKDDDGTIDGEVRTYRYNDNFFLEKEFNFDSPDVEYWYDRVGNIVSSTAGRSVETKYFYDSLYRLRLTEYDDGTDDITTDYDPNGNVTNTVNGVIEKTYEYDKNENLIAESIEIGGEHNVSYASTHTYNDNDYLTLDTYPSGLEVDYQPDVLGRPTKVGSFASNVVFHPTGQLDSLSLGNSKTVKYDLDIRRFPQKITASGAVDISYTYDPAGNISSISDALDSARSISMPEDAYDGLNRLRKVSGSWGLAEYDYRDNAPADISSRKINGKTSSYRYGGTTSTGLISTFPLVFGTITVPGPATLVGIDIGADQQRMSYEYDRLGNISIRKKIALDNNAQEERTLETDTFEFDANSRLVSANVGGQTETYLYDAGGMKSVTLGDDIRQRQYEFYSAAGQLMFEDIRKDCALTDYVYLGRMLLAKSADKIFQDTEDADEDGLNDCYEYSINQNVNDASDGNVDTDGDGVTDKDELTVYFSDPFESDTDGDGVNDGDEIAAGTSLLIDESQFNDDDGDGYSNRQEDALSELGLFNRTGQKLWQWDFETTITTPVSVDPQGMLYFGDDKGVLFAVFPTGKVRWTFDSGNSGITTQPVIDVTDGTVYFGDASGAVFAVTNNGKLKWQHQTPSSILSSFALGVSGDLLVGSGNELISFTKQYDVDLNQGIVKWRTPLSGSISSQTGPVLGFDDTVYIGDSASVLYSVNEATGDIQWQTTLGASIEQSAPLLTHKEVMLLDNQGVIYRVSQATGELLATIENPESDTRTYLIAEDDYSPDGEFLIAVNQRTLNGIRSYRPDGLLVQDLDVGAQSGYLAMDQSGQPYAQSTDGKITGFRRNSSSSIFDTDPLNEASINFAFASDHVVYQAFKNGKILAFSNSVRFPIASPIWSMKGHDSTAVSSIVGSFRPAIDIHNVPSDLVLFVGQEYFANVSAKSRKDGDISDDIEFSLTNTQTNGTGASFQLPTTIPRIYRGRVEVTDSNGRQTQRDFTYQVAANFAPALSVTPLGVSAVLQEDLPITFSGSAVDDFDGDISDSISWSSNIDGELGTGGNLSVEHLSIGEHTISALVSDRGGLSDASEFELVVVTGADNDPDNDNLSNSEEIALGSNPLRADTDFDGLNDDVEATLGLNFLWRDTDHDGLTDAAEIILDTDPFADYGEALSDADGDGFSNRQEEAVGANMIDPTSMPNIGDLMWSVPRRSLEQRFPRINLDGLNAGRGGEYDNVLALSAIGLLYSGDGVISYRDGFIKAESGRPISNNPVLGLSGQAYYGGGCAAGIYKLSEEGVVSQFAFTDDLMTAIRCIDIAGFPMDLTSSAYTSPSVNESETLFVGAAVQSTFSDFLYVGYNSTGDIIARYPNGIGGFFPETQLITSDDDVILTPFDAYYFASHSSTGEINWEANSRQGSFSIADQNGNVFNSSSVAYDREGNFLWEGLTARDLLMNEGDAIYRLTTPASFLGLPSEVQKVDPITGNFEVFDECSASRLHFIGRDKNLYVRGGAGLRVCDPQGNVIAESTARIGSIFRGFGAGDTFAVDRDGVVYSFANRTLSAFVTKSGGLNNGQWPKSLHDNRNSGAQNKTPIGPDAARILTPFSGSRLTADQLTLTWEDSNADEYRILVGTAVGLADISEQTVEAGITSAQFLGLPQNNQPVYITLVTKVGELEASDQAAYHNIADLGIDSFTPVIFTPADQLIEATGLLTDAVIGSATALDREDGALSVTANSSLTSFPLGITKIIWTATDSDGNTGTKIQIIEVRDTINPTLTVPGDVFVASEQPLAIEIGKAQANDLLPVEITNNAPELFNLGTTIVTWTATDSSGNQVSKDQRVLVRVPDPSAPVVTAPADIVAEATGLTTQVDLGVATAVDLEDGIISATANDNGPFELGVHLVFWHAQDSSRKFGEATQLVTIVDTTAPALTAPVNLTLSASEPMEVTLGEPTATDIYAVTVTNDAPDLFPLGVTTVTWVATDANGNSAQAQQTVTIEAEDKPDTPETEDRPELQIINGALMLLLDEEESKAKSNETNNDAKALPAEPDSNPPEKSSSPEPSAKAPTLSVPSDFFINVSVPVQVPAKATLSRRIEYEYDAITNAAPTNAVARLGHNPSVVADHQLSALAN